MNLFCFSLSQTDIDHCKRPAGVVGGPCPQGVCINEIGATAAKCACHRGHYGEWPNCTKFCDINPCGDRGTCEHKADTNDFVCR